MTDPTEQELASNWAGKFEFSGNEDIYHVKDKDSSAYFSLAHSFFHNNEYAPRLAHSIQEYMEEEGFDRRDHYYGATKDRVIIYSNDSGNYPMGFSHDKNKWLANALAAWLALKAKG